MFWVSLGVKRELCGRPLVINAPRPFLPSDAPVGKKKKVPTKGIVKKSPAPTKGVVIKSPAPIKGIVIRSPALSGLPFVSSDSVRVPGPNGSGLSMPAAERLATPLL